MSETTTDGRGGPTFSSAMNSVKALDPAEEYKMDHKQKSLALIFNQELFGWKQNKMNRKGSSVDRENLRTRLEALKFEVKLFDNLKKNEIETIIEKAAQEDHSDRGCFLLVFLSHGEGDLLSAYDEDLSIKAMTALFKGDKCPSLVGKPKIFIFQACRGKVYDDPVTPCSADNEQKQEVEEKSGVQTLPAGADFLMCYSVAEGYYSFRNTEKGSWYIQDLCELLKEHGNSLEFTDVLMLVNRKVSMRTVENAKDSEAIGKKQVPCFASMLRKKLYFRPKE